MRPTPPGIDVLEPLGEEPTRVHRGLVRSTGRVVVVKTATSDDRAAVEALRREAHVLGRVDDPGVVELLDLIEHEGATHLVLHHVVGGSLAQHIAARRRLRPGEVTRLGARLAATLAALHAAGVVHRDVHPGNVLLDGDLTPVLCDLGAAHDPTAPPIRQDGIGVGTAACIDPRAAAGAAPAPEHDLYGLGCVLWTALAGSPPHGLPGDDDDAVLAAAGRRQRPALRALAEVDDALADVVEGLLDHALPDAATAARALRAAAGALASATAELGAGGADGHGPALTAGGTRQWGPRAPGPPAPDPGVARRWVVAAIALLAVPAAAALLALRVGAGPAVVSPPPPCADAASGGSTAGADATVLLADLAGEGCSRPVRHDADDGVLTTPDGARFALGRPGDVLLLGDWDGDGRWSAALHRPSTRQVFLFEEVADGAASTSAPARAVGAGEAVVVDGDGDGRHEVRVGTALVGTTAAP